MRNPNVSKATAYFEDVRIRIISRDKINFTICYLKDRSFYFTKNQMDYEHIQDDVLSGFNFLAVRKTLWSECMCTK